MKSKPGAAMVEMGDCYAVDRAISHLNNNFLFNQKLNVWYVLNLMGLTCVIYLLGSRAKEPILNWLFF